ncbi:MAG: hypothetical protein AB1489_22960 [Acidobacteriota bacterium]
MQLNVQERIKESKQPLCDALNREQRLKSAARLYNERDRIRKLLAMAAESRLADEPSEGRRKIDCLYGNKMRDLASDNRAAILQRLHQINDALERLENGRYGCCINCRAKINWRRLTVDPAIAYCAHCQTTIRQDDLPKDLWQYLQRH